jgi:2-polyprenyl-6-hydroxyphenyl methylase/3-demethylubiquinone-9 3-methyltransferase
MQSAATTAGSIRPAAGQVEKEYRSSSQHHRYLLPILLEALSCAPGKKLIDVGCGAGGVGGALAKSGYDVIGVDTWPEGIELARKYHAPARFEVGSCYDDLAARFGTFPLVVSSEVIEHLYDPRRFMHVVKSLMEPNGHLVLTTPYHGFTKNLMISLTNSWDAHLDPLWDHGHIKFWSERTLTKLLNEFDMEPMRVWRAGRFGPLAKSIVMLARHRQA